MDGVNTNKIARDMRPEMLSAKAQKIRFWIDDVDVKVKRRLEERIKIIPDVATRLRSPPRRSSSIKLIKQPSDLKQLFMQNQPTSGFDIDEEEVIMIESPELQQATSRISDLVADESENNLIPSKEALVKRNITSYPKKTKFDSQKMNDRSLFDKKAA